MDTTIAPVDAQRAAYPVRQGNHIELWFSELPFYTRLLEAMRQAQHSVWITISFLNRDFRFPSGERWWDVLEALAQDGKDVRILYWRNPAFFSPRNVFQGSPQDLAFLKKIGARWSARWDSSGQHPGHCHHQKTWIIDADTPHAVAFVGGMVKTQDNLPQRVALGGQERRHDVTLELRGPCTKDVAHNFVQRWNAPGADPSSPAPWPDHNTAGDLPFPTHNPTKQGQTTVQIHRTIRPGLYRPDDCTPFPIHRGETSIYEAYKNALNAAQSTIYLENQHPGEETLLDALQKALDRGVDVLYVVPSLPMEAICKEKNRAKQGPTRYRNVFNTLAALASHPRFTLAGLCRPAPWHPEGLEEVYVHAKVCIVDGCWGTVGSANMVDLSMAPDHTEMNASFWGQREALDALKRLIGAHAYPTHLPQDSDTSVLTAAGALARRNATQKRLGKPLSGAIYALDPRAYGDTFGQVALWSATEPV